ncbi:MULTISPECIES: aldo/keto reductase [unclassified Mesorhizobium]|uniref:aldo/keto reductase n=1 Tax=unclassified Mesorhizobium TaxID=325217 RepID=UPI000F75FA77|nr:MULTISPECIES: aldo/keto reductase [unclassified Mesorhizobium]AZO06539.1 aldo/keto reductase [Mesorhizobium sp. M2A.F.Ca.ET.043.02.1.1]RUW35329.1 aldo/keto reductase [Mesorhizobium sp. M2A.F.Ca.ET.015.02.1.1]RUW65031.1 aldo/keto reductase [Mesorhizobium sp. M2A.F.Ca.ET.067.02.1.1]RVC94016.1 aldo/keto reductase [Mesorhizobium sp. M2A.F.Ca.ET.017.03.2.1]RVC95101.1 aldo/keto reductase [Mesorhizobium sp. M2A.F.Ca.ET.029.05.1.1]
MPEQLTLNDGSTIPQIGLGVWQVDPDITAKVVRWGIEAGYRLIDTAEGYRNEEGVGEAIRAAGVPRNELFITSKLRNGAHQRDAALRAFDDTMQKLGIDRIDLFLIHWPVPSQNKYVEAWKTLVELKQAGRIKSVGVSNFNQDHLERIIGETGVTPVVNQIELHPRFQQRDKRDFHKKHNIHIESWSPLGSGRLLSDPTLEKLAKKHGKSVAQVIIRWHLQEGLIVIPKSIHQERIAGNFDVFGFELDEDDMQTIRGLDSADGRTGPDPATAAFLF